MRTDSATAAIRASARAHLFVNTCVSLYLGRPYLSWAPIRYVAVRRLSAELGLPTPEVHQLLLRETGRAWRSPLVGGLARGGYRLRRRRLFQRMEAAKAAIAGAPEAAPAPDRRPSQVTRGGGGPAPLVSIVMLSYGRNAYLERSLRAVVARTQGQPIEIVVVDNGSTDGSVETIRAAFDAGWISKGVLLRRNCGISPAYNAGFHLADPRSQLLMKLDADIELQSPDWLERVVALFDAAPHRIGVVALDQDNHLGLRLPRTRRRHGARVADMAEWPCGSAMIFQREVMERIGNFVDVAGKQYVYDDVDYCNRALRHGLETLILRDARVHHQRFLDGGALRHLVVFNQGQRAAEDTLRLAHEYDSGKRPIAWSTRPTEEWLASNVAQLLGG